LNDVVVHAQGHEAEYFCQIIKDQFDVLYQEGAESGRVMCIALHPYWIGQPHRAKYLDEALSYILAMTGCGRPRQTTLPNTTSNTTTMTSWPT
jgi:hypothetical protein